MIRNHFRAPIDDRSTEVQYFLWMDAFYNDLGPDPVDVSNRDPNTYFLHGVVIDEGEDRKAIMKHSL
jgi:hypothetical protein